MSTTKQDKAQTSVDYMNLHPDLFREYFKATLAHDEEVVCENATIVANSAGMISWINNDKVIPIIITSKIEE